MARTAPIPNIPAIPGMNPGAWIMGGGGSGGGSGGKGGKGNGGDQGASGNNGGNGPNGGGKNAGSCGPGSGGGCPNPSHGNASLHAGDPIDPVTGRVYTTEVIDLALPGPIPFVLTRAYSTSSRELDVGLGHGWSHAFAWVIEERRRSLHIHQPNAAPLSTTVLEPGQSAQLPCGLVMRHAAGYTIDSDGLSRIFTEVAPRTFVLSSIRDANDNRIELGYERGLLATLVDSVGRLVRVRRHPDQRISAFEVKNASLRGQWMSFRTYEYDECGDLVRVTDADGSMHRFVYDDDHRLVRRQEPGGLVAEFRYDATGRGFESWCHREGQDGLDADVPVTLADGTTMARGFLHVRVQYSEDFTEVVTSRAVRRIEGNHLHKPDKVVFGGGVHTYRYDAAGSVLEYTDALGNAWSNKRDAFGRLLATTDPLGATTSFDYDERGSVIGTVDALGGTSRYQRDERGNVLRIDDSLGLVAAFAYDARGLLVSATLPNGGITEISYDEMANRIRIVEPDGGTRRMYHDYLGRLLAWTDELGNETRFTYDACGRLRTARRPRGGVTSFEYDADGNRTRVTDADGRTTLLRWGGFRVVTEIVRPDGNLVRYRYDREQDLVRILNEAGEEHRLVRSSEGRIVEERTFDGRIITYLHDAASRVVSRREGSTTIAYMYDAMERLLSRAYSDGRKDAFAYDALGRMERAERGGVAVEFTYDARGRVTREVTHHAGRSAVAEWTYDATDRPSRVTGTGGTIAVTRDLMGRSVEVTYGDSSPLRLRYDLAGNDVERLLPDGGRVVTETNADGLVARCAVYGRHQGPQPGAGQPDWIGKIHHGETFLEARSFSPADFLEGTTRLDSEALELVRDRNARVVERRTGQSTRESAGFGPTGDLYVLSTPRVYGPGGRPLTRGDASYRHDERGRLIEKHIQASDGARVWAYTWTDDDQLVSVRGPGGVEVVLTYDALARRVEKRTLRDGRVEGITRYHWRGDVLAHEIREQASAVGDPILSERSYIVDPGSFLPLAHRDETGAVMHYVYGQNGAPIALVGDEGALRATGDTSLQGSIAGSLTEATSLRFAGQYADEETGLFYNHHRYYDPETACYLSPEPLGLFGSLKPYAYTDNHPFDRVDVDGLARMEATITRTNGLPPITARSGGNHQPGDLHPAVQAALPPNPARAADDPSPSHRCAEPQALTAYLNDWETRNAPRTCRPGDPAWRNNLGEALGEIDPNGGIASSMNGVPRAACPNCSQTIPRLWGLAGQRPPNNVIAPGYQGQRRRGPFGPTSPPSTPFRRDPTNQMASTDAYGNQNVGTWTHGPNGWRRSAQP